MSTTNGSSGKDLGPEDFESIRDAVMETPRGRWFLGEYANRLRAKDTVSLLDSMKRLEQAVSTNHDIIMERLSQALVRDPQAAPSPPAPQPDLAPKHMKYFKQDEDIFEPAPQAKITVVAEQPKIEVPKGAKLIIRRTSETSAAIESTDVIETSPAVPGVATPSETPAPAPTESATTEQDSAEPVVTSETSALAEERPASPAGEPSSHVASTQIAESAQQPDTHPKRRIVIIRHKAGEDIDVPLQNDMAEAS